MTVSFPSDDMGRLMSADMDVLLICHQLAHRDRHGVIRMMRLRRWQMIQTRLQITPESHTDIIAMQPLGRSFTRICLTTRLVLVEKPISHYPTRSILICQIYRAYTSSTMDRRPSLVHRNVQADQAVLIGRVRRAMGAVVRQAGRDISVRIVLDGNFPIHN
jgi:hypothetical protein